MARKGRTFWIAKDPINDGGGQYCHDSKKMVMINGYWRTQFERDLLDAPNNEHLSAALQEYGPKLKPGEQVRVRIVVEE